ncbi:hypothetical protein FT663_00070 [Candidozyma haemuli var. vulneris]|uniref:Uncharacterized protein n=1 Tax=Candidozyma haemuli TaxID=45357 RepID=A0A2V1AVP8_9ASCO|nr:hypothetical protein CXQ85_000859 [[Candida] haemuloni]KAF3994050.1 hypothetical protein FT662_00236 [[Candida] haemuloni var. vulneris]KAF3995847.1 hypothetical protein FT663_00070 [[Candida] haemuloni var. vulneris]PVH21864.1 hypothetical protein CXQ85_000859 [[Candida] haemuloni]
MYIANDLASLIPREDDGTETARSFRSWDTCMDNNVCRITACVGITVAILVGIAIFAACVRGCRHSLSFSEAFCCCCPCGRRVKYEEPVELKPIQDPVMYPPKRYFSQPPPPQAPPAYHVADGYEGNSNGTVSGYYGPEVPDYRQEKNWG